MKEYLIDTLQTVSPDIVESALILASFRHYGIEPSRITELYGAHTITTEVTQLANALFEYKQDITVFDLANDFELLIDGGRKRALGVVFTPKHISDFILEGTIDSWQDGHRLLDLASGCGSFLLAAIEKIRTASQQDLRFIIENNIYGIDICEENIERTKTILSFYCLIHGAQGARDYRYNLLIADSLLDVIDAQFTQAGFDFIVGNPPYVNTHDLDTDMIKQLKERYVTTRTGTFNIFYAFIEKGVSLLAKNGRLGFIIPNNFIYIEAAQPLRKFFMEEQNLSKIVDFGDNLPFNPVKTYCAIIFLDKTPHKRFEYARLALGQSLEGAPSFTVKLNSLTDQRWHLLPDNDRQNIKKIESFDTKIGVYIRTGIATLSDKTYTIDLTHTDGEYYLKEFEGQTYKIEKGIVRNLVKVGGRAKDTSVHDSLGIIFPYHVETGATIIPVKYLKKHFPHTFAYFEKVRPALLKRDKGKVNYPIWYMYGRSQGLAAQGRKIFFPTFNKFPRFELDASTTTLFYNGYALFVDESPYKDHAATLVRILNSMVMKYYIDLTSYSIEGGYKCYQKKYVQNFSIPHFSATELKQIESLDDGALDTFLVNAYNLTATPELLQILNSKP